MTRDIEAAYRQALIQEYEAYTRAGRADMAYQVAAVLRDQYGYDVEPPAKKQAPERADASPPPEKAVPSSPKRRKR